MRAVPDNPACPHQSVCSTVPAHLHFHSVASYSGIAALRAITINHRNAGLAGLQHLSIEPEAAAALHDDLTRRGIESVVLRTCNRTEVYWRARVPGDDETVMTTFVEAVGAEGAALGRTATRLSGEEAARHLFRVSCGLESLVLGEAEILGQIKTALSSAIGAGAFLEGVFRAALRTGRQARAETAIGAGALSVASAAVHWLAAELPLRRSRVLVIGAGDTGAKTVRLLRSLGAGRLAIANRTVSKAEAVARPVGGQAMGLDDLTAELAIADAVICAAATPSWLVTREQLREAARGRQLIVIDLAMPAGIEPCDEAGVVRMDLASLEGLAELHRQQREAEIPAVEAVITRELQWLHAWARHQALRPLVSDLRRKVEAVRRTELARAEREVADLDAAGAQALDRLSRRLIDQILSIPLAQLEAGDLPLDATHAEYLRRLFALAPATPAETESPVQPEEVVGSGVRS